MFVIRNGLRWRDAPKDDVPHLAELSAKGGKPDQLMINATHLKAHRTAASLLKEGLLPDVWGVSKAA